MTEDNVTVYLRNSTAPHEIVDSASAVLNNNGTALFTFNNVSNGVSYYIQLKHRNSLETWSATPQIFMNDFLSYNFSTAAAQAYGNNMTQVDGSPLRFGVYSGDVDQDGIIDASDLSKVDNDAFISLTGYVNTDLTGDNFVDASDISIADNNVAKSVIVIRP